MAHVLGDIEKRIRALDRRDQRVLRTLLRALEARAGPDADTSSADAVRAEIEMDLAAANDYVARHGSFADLAREHYASADDGAV